MRIFVPNVLLLNQFHDKHSFYPSTGSPVQFVEHAPRQRQTAGDSGSLGAAHQSANAQPTQRIGKGSWTPPRWHRSCIFYRPYVAADQRVVLSELFLIPTKAFYAPLALLDKFSNNFFKVRVFGWKKEWSGKIDANSTGSLAQPRKDVANIDCNDGAGPTKVIQDAFRAAMRDPNFFRLPSNFVQNQTQPEEMPAAIGIGLVSRRNPVIEKPQNDYRGGLPPQRRREPSRDSHPNQIEIKITARCGGYRRPECQGGTGRVLNLVVRA
jgi:hypothetical protein